MLVKVQRNNDSTINNLKTTVCVYRAINSRVYKMQLAHRRFAEVVNLAMNAAAQSQGENCTAPAGLWFNYSLSRLMHEWSPAIRADAPLHHLRE